MLLRYGAAPPEHQVCACASGHTSSQRQIVARRLGLVNAAIVRKLKRIFHFTTATRTPGKLSTDDLYSGVNVFSKQIPNVLAELPHTGTSAVHTPSFIFWHADFTVFSRYPQGTQEWFGDTTHSLTPKNAPEHRAHVV